MPLLNLNMEEIGKQLAQFGTNLLLTIAILSLGFAVSAFLQKNLVKVLLRKNKDDRTKKTLNSVFVSFIKYGIFFILLCMVLPVWGVQVHSLITVAGIGSVALGLGAQSLVKDILMGLFILLEDQFGVGDVITVSDRTGTVEAIGIRTTRIRSLDGEVHIIPNGEISVVTNMSKEFKRAFVEVTLRYDTDVDKALGTLADEMRSYYQSMEEQQLPGLKAEPQVLGITNLQKAGITVRILADCDIGENWGIEREIRRRVKVRLDREGIGLTGTVVSKE